MPVRLTETGDDGKFETCVQPMYIMIVDFSVLNFLVRNSDEYVPWRVERARPHPGPEYGTSYFTRSFINSV